MMEKILFVCVENAGRSQMAEAFFRKYLEDRFEPISAGTNPAAKVNPIVIQAMEEIGIDIKGKIPKIISQQMINQAKVTINMGCMGRESCPALFLKDVIDWKIPDPKGNTIDEVRKIRDQIEQEVKKFIASMTGEIQDSNQKNTLEP